MMMMIIIIIVAVSISHLQCVLLAATVLPICNECVSAVNIVVTAAAFVEDRSCLCAALCL